MKNSIREHREARNWSQRELASRLGVSPQRISQLEESEKPLPPELLKKMSRVMAVSEAAIILEPERPDSVLEIFSWDQMLTALLKNAGELNGLATGEARDRALIKIAQVITAMRSKNARDAAAMNEGGAPDKTNPAVNLSSKGGDAARAAAKSAADAERNRGPK